MDQINAKFNITKNIAKMMSWMKNIKMIRVEKVLKY